VEGWKRFEGKKIYVILKNKRTYSGMVLEIESSGEECFIIIKDKFGAVVSFNSNEIDVMEEEK